MNMAHPVDCTCFSCETARDVQPAQQPNPPRHADAPDLPPWAPGSTVNEVVGRMLARTSPDAPGSAPGAPSGRKLDAGKRRWSLLPWESLARVVDVLEHGARKYAVDNWQLVPDARRRYLDAALRHVLAHAGGEKTDAESGLPALAHAVASLLFLMWFEADPSRERPAAVDDPR